MDREVKIHIEQAAPFQKVEIRANFEDDRGFHWDSWAEFEADEAGRIHVEEKAPLRGTYEGIDGMGLFWSMKPNSTNRAAFPVANDPFTMEVEAYSDQQCIARQTVTRYFKASEIKRIEVREMGLVGTLFIPPSDEPLPVIISLGGSEGGLKEGRAKLLASHGFATLALRYFGFEGLPPGLQNIPLEYFETAFEWLKKQSMIDGTRIGIFGVSRGGELSLILGSFFPDAMRGIVAAVPSSVVNQGYSVVHAWTF